MGGEIGNQFASKWPVEHDDFLKRKRDEGFSSSQISADFWRELRVLYTRNAVIGRASRMGLVSKNPAGKSAPKKRKPQAYKPRPKPVKAPVIPPLTAEVIALRCAAVEPRNLTLIELEPHSCRWPYGDENFVFCGHPQIEGQPYCLDHFHLSRRPDSRKERAA